MVSLGSLKYRLGFALRETGQALERVGCVFQGIASYQEELSRHATVLNAGLHMPKVATTAFLAPNASVVGDVTVGDHSSVWYNAVVRGDSSSVSIGHNTNLQDSVHVGSLTANVPPTRVGSHVSVGHGAVLQGCTVHDGVLVGMNAVLQEGVMVESGAMVAAGAVVPEHTIIPAGELWGGNPARKLRDLKPEEAQHLKELPGKYQELAKEHRQVLDFARARMAQHMAPCKPDAGSK